jgi:tetrathionate reductase subunit B
LKPTSSRRDFVKVAGMGIVGTALGAGTAVAQAESKQAKVKWGFLMDGHRCKGCLACVVACKTEWEVPLGAFRCAVKDYEYGSYPDTRRSFIPTLCNQCDKPGCVEACPTDVVEHTFTDSDGTEIKYKDKAATFKQPDGIVEIDHSKCTGCGKCLDGCPYGVRFRHKRIKAGDPPPGKELEAADKCNFCAHRLKEGIVPSCVNTCPGSARLIGDLNDPESEISKRLAEHKDEVQVLLKDKGTDPQCFYIGMEVKNLDKAFRDGVDQRDQYDLES